MFRGRSCERDKSVPGACMSYNRGMKIRVLLFAVLAQKAGAREMTLDLPERATVGDALRRITEAHPIIADHRKGLSVAVNMSYVGLGQTLGDGDELALIPPVSGG